MKQMKTIVIYFHVRKTRLNTTKDKLAWLSKYKYAIQAYLNANQYFKGTIENKNIIKRDVPPIIRSKCDYVYVKSRN